MISDDCKYMIDNTDEFMRRVFDGKPQYFIEAHMGMVSAHGDKTRQYRDYWESMGLEYKKAQVIYFLTFTELMDMPKSKSKEWVVEKYNFYKDMLPEHKYMQAFSTTEAVYHLDDLIMTREYGIHPESKEPMNGCWVVRNRVTGQFIDNDRYSNDLKERHGFK